eukprot:Filipodium_phascolosomae@DN4008_c0_g1_i1.p1
MLRNDAGGYKEVGEAGSDEPFSCPFDRLPAVTQGLRGLTASQSFGISNDCNMTPRVIIYKVPAVHPIEGVYNLYSPFHNSTPREKKGRRLQEVAGDVDIVDTTGKPNVMSTGDTNSANSTSLYSLIQQQPIYLVLVSLLVMVTMFSVTILMAVICRKKRNKPRLSTMHKSRQKSKGHIPPFLDDRASTNVPKVVNREMNEKSFNPLSASVTVISPNVSVQNDKSYISSHIAGPPEVSTTKGSTSKSFSVGHILSNLSYQADLQMMKWTTMLRDAYYHYNDGPKMLEQNYANENRKCSISVDNAKESVGGSGSVMSATEIVKLNSFVR